MISVCLASYNGARFIEEQVRSVLSQLGPADELVVSDDGSTDATLPLLRAMGDARIRIIEGPHRRSPIWNFEHALRQARGEYIFLCDQDDLWEPDKVAVAMRCLEHCDCVVSDCSVIDAEGRELEPSFFALNATRPGRLYNLLVKNGYLGCCMAFRRCVLTAALPFPADTPMHDIWIGNVAAFRYRLTFIPDRLMRYRRHGDNASSASDASRYGFWARVRFRWVVVRALFS